MQERCLSPAHPGESISLSWSTDPDSAMLREAGPAEFDWRMLGLFSMVTFGLPLQHLGLVVVSESPDLPVGPAVSGEGMVRVDGCVRLVPST